MFRKLMRAIGDGLRSLAAELEDAWEAMNRGEAPGAKLEAAPVVHDCADDLEHLR